MAKKPAPTDSSPLGLLVSREDARQKIDQQIEKGTAVAALQVRSEADLEVARHQSSKWQAYTAELLKRLFTNDSMSAEFVQFWGSFSNMDDGLMEHTEDLREDVRNKVHRLDSIKDRLDLLPEPDAARAPAVRVAPSTRTRRVFVVHGHDEGTREAVCRFLEKLRLEPVVLHEQANEGNTIIEKFELHSEVGFAVVLLTMDDVGASKESVASLRPRARQNVILELGYFMGKIGRPSVCALYQVGVELPSDYDGVIYLELNDGWHLALAKEIKAAGIEIDMNLAV